MAATLFFSCGSSRKMNRTLEVGNSEMLYGEVNREAFQKSGYESWFSSEYKNYEAGQPYVDELKTYSDKISKVVIILATWCPDTRRELPRVLNVLDAMNLPKDNIEMYAVDYDKENDVKGFEKYEFSRVPTIIFYEGDNEIGRIVEQPEMTLEEDMIAIFRNYYGNK
jgi:thiol-disulfide isomerase/thioredoxin